MFITKITTTPSGLLVLVRPHLDILAEEINAGRTRRVLCVEQILAETPNEFADWDLSEAAHEVRYGVAGYIGSTLADDDDDEDSYGIPAIESFLLLSQLYGPNWVRLAYARALCNSDVACNDPYAVASALMEKAKADANYAEVCKKAA